MKKYEYDYTTLSDGKQIAVNVTTGECHDTITLTVPLGTQLITPEQQRAHAESKNAEKPNTGAEQQMPLSGNSAWSKPHKTFPIYHHRRRHG